MANSLDGADVNTLVLETGRRLETAVRKLVPDGVDAQGRPLTLGPRMRAIRERLGPEAWAAYEAWSRERNAYTHAEIRRLGDEAAFRQNFERVQRRLRALAREDAPRSPSRPKRRAGAKAKPGAGRPGETRAVAIAVALVLAVLAYFSC